ncbi:carboxylesterase/lipase family protein [Paraburkholderia oxyphila]|uniref:carboxylesterase/lipase family protein n=1 Tax=Paraburkholderia oxyphila TaxID=614212 RepID=UPI0006937CE6|nr:carboxylesterase family protein [Paraburkholderia oxyphila]
MKNTILTRCEQGALEGVTNDGVHTFFDIPYASDSGRFKPAGEPARWSGQRDATRPGPVFPQLPGRLDFVMGAVCKGVPQSEDAFRLNVFTPEMNGSLPVVFWIHGGGFMTGGALPCYSGDALARFGRAVVVTMNYRLGVLGNLYMEGVSPGNLSVSDLERALQWVRDNIAGFGGDPNSIVVAGQSAGAWYAQLLAAMPATHEHVKAIAMLSYPGLQPMAPEKAHAGAVRLCESAGLSSGDELAKLPVERILHEQARMLGTVAQFAEVPIVFMPVASERVPADPGAAAQASFGRKPVLIGWTRDETASFFASHPPVLAATEAQALEKFELEWGVEGPSRYASVASGRFDHKPYAALIELSSEKLINEPTRQFASRMAKAGSDVFAYRFDFQSRQQNIGACHCFELPFLFGNFANWADAPMLAQLDAQLSGALSTRFQGHFLNFVESGNPNGEGLPTWARYNGADDELMYLK